MTVTPYLIGRDHFAITPHNTTPLAQVAHAIYVGGAGDVTFTSIAGTSVTWVACPVGLIIPMGATLVSSTGTTATNLVGIII